MNCISVIFTGSNNCLKIAELKARGGAVGVTDVREVLGQQQIFPKTTCVPKKLLKKLHSGIRDVVPPLV